MESLQFATKNKRIKITKIYYPRVNLSNLPCHRNNVQKPPRNRYQPQNTSHYLNRTFSAVVITSPNVALISPRIASNVALVSALRSVCANLYAHNTLESWKCPPIPWTSWWTRRFST